MLAAVAARHGALYDRTLTGFKWICNAALDLEAEGRGEFVFGYEEALGYSVGRTVRDKDGISAAVAFAALAAVAKASGETVWDRLGALYRRDGLWVSTQQSIVRIGTDGAAEIAGAMERIGRSTPERLGRYAVTAATDYLEGAAERPRYLGATPLVELTLGDSGRALVRPSGTEPKLKIYVDLREEADGGGMWRDQEARLLGSADTVAEDLARFLGF
jgi:phosphomannomutase